MLHSFKPYAIFFIALLFVVIVYGAIPFLSLPASPIQIVWASGFAESFVNAGWPSVKAINFGYPTEAPIAFGLSGVFVQSFFIAAFDLHATDAYAAASIFWLTIALLGSILLCQILGAKYSHAAFLSLGFLTLPIVWNHAGYSLLSFGFALLPLYVYMAFQLSYYLPTQTTFSKTWVASALLYFSTMLIAIFMDGYTFMMFFCASGLIWMVALIRKNELRQKLVIQSLPILLISALLAYFLYVSYIGMSTFSSPSMDFFRGWGVDLMMLIAPSKGVMWLWDTLGVSLPRSNQEFFGDGSVWVTTFALPFLIIGGAGFILSRKHQFAFPLLCIALMGFYFALGPSLKANSIRPQNSSGEYEIKGSLMPAKYAIMPTGNAFIYKYVPGFKNMRATYRWTGLMLVGFFGLVVLFYLYLLAAGYTFFGITVLILLLLSNSPDILKRLENGIRFKQMMHQMDRDFSELSDYVGQGARVFFAPPGNDFIVNYIASTGGYYAYNTGGDKNLYLARQNWPEAVKLFPIMGSGHRKLGSCFSEKIARVLQNKNIDFVVLPNFNLRDNANKWPPSKKSIATYKRGISYTIGDLTDNKQYNIQSSNFYTIISRNAEYAPENSPILSEHMELNRPVKLANLSCNLRLSNLLSEGWHKIENWGVWSSSKATLTLSLPTSCRTNSDCILKLLFRVYNATPKSPKKIFIALDGYNISELYIDSRNMHEHLITLKKEFLNSNDAQLSLYVPGAQSPASLKRSNDSRTLGIGLREFELLQD